MYEPADPSMQALKDLDSLKQAGTAESYPQESNEFLCRLPPGKMYDFDKVNRYRHGLKPALLKDMVRNRGQAPSYVDLTDIYDHAAFMDFQLHHEGRTPENRRVEGQSSQEAKKAKSNEGPSSSGVKMAKGRKNKFRARLVKREAALKSLQGLLKEKKRLFAEGRCSICKGKGHRAFACPKKGNSQENKK